MATPVVEQPLVISPHEASAITDEVQRLITAGDELSAWERVRHLHPADIGTIVSALPSTSRDAIVTVVSPDTVAWMLRQMNPIQAARIGTRQGTGMLSSALSQVHPRVALETLRRLPVARVGNCSRNSGFWYAMVVNSQTDRRITAMTDVVRR